MFLHLFFIITSFAVIWYGAGLVVRGVEHLARKLNISSFATSFFLLGILTSIPELSVGINSIFDKRPEIYVGNLIGASLVIFILVIPILAILGNGVKLATQLTPKNLRLSLLVTAAPVFFIADKRIGLTEAIFFIFLYAVLFYQIEKKKGLLEQVEDALIKKQNHILHNIAMITVGAVLIFLASKVVVDETIFLSTIIGVSPYLISLLGLSIGTNLPEISIAIRSVLAGRKDIAFGDYVGSASANTLMFGSLVLFGGEPVILTNHFWVIFLSTIAGFALFYVFARSRSEISKKEGIWLLGVYVLFVLVEIFG